MTQENSSSRFMVFTASENIQLSRLTKVDTGHEDILARSYFRSPVPRTPPNARVHVSSDLYHFLNKVGREFRNYARNGFLLKVFRTHTPTPTSIMSNLETKIFLVVCSLTERPLDFYFRGEPCRPNPLGLTLVLKGITPKVKKVVTVPGVTNRLF